MKWFVLKKKYILKKKINMNYCEMKNRFCVEKWWKIKAKNKWESKNKKNHKEQEIENL